MGRQGGRDRPARLPRAAAPAWYTGDALGSLCLSTTDAGAIRGAASYDPWGVPQTAQLAPFGFTGELQQGEQVYLRARWYDGARGSFGVRDPFAGFAGTPYSLAPYQYGYSNPVLWTDPSGEAPDYPTPQEGQLIHRMIVSRRPIRLIRIFRESP